MEHEDSWAAFHAVPSWRLSTEGQFDKVFRISGKNSLAAEVHDLGCADFFYNARELFRILKRTGTDPTRRPEEAADALAVEAPEPTTYAAVLAPIHWEVGGEAEKALKSGEAFDLIRLGA